MHDSHETFQEDDEFKRSIPDLKTALPHGGGA